MQEAVQAAARQRVPSGWPPHHGGAGSEVPGSVLRPLPSATGLLLSDQAAARAGAAAAAGNLQRLPRVACGGLWVRELLQTVHQCGAGVVQAWQGRRVAALSPPPSVVLC